MRSRLVPSERSRGNSRDSQRLSLSNEDSLREREGEEGVEQRRDASVIYFLSFLSLFFFLLYAKLRELGCIINAER